MKRKYISMLTVKVALVCAAAAVAVVLALKLTSAVGETTVTIEKSDSIDITPEVIRSIKAIGEWEFLSVADEELADTVRRGLLSDDHLARVYYGTMRLGVNLHQAGPGWIKASGDTVVMTLPPVTLLDNDFIDEARTRPFHESGRWSQTDRDALYDKARRAMLRRGLTKANIDAAQENGEVQMRGMLESMGFRHVTVKFAR